jgi:hypothetical protein
MCDIPFYRSILQHSNGIRHVMPSTDRMLELTAKHRWLSRLTAGCVFQWVNFRLNITFVPKLLNITIMTGTSQFWRNIDSFHNFSVSKREINKVYHIWTMSNGTKKRINVKNNLRYIKFTTTKPMEFVRLTFNIDKGSDETRKLRAKCRGSGVLRSYTRERFLSKDVKGRKFICHSETWKLHDPTWLPVTMEDSSNTLRSLKHSAEQPSLNWSCTVSFREQVCLNIWINNIRY